MNENQSNNRDQGRVSHRYLYSNLLDFIERNCYDLFIFIPLFVIGLVKFLVNTFV